MARFSAPSGASSVPAHVPICETAERLNLSKLRSTPRGMPALKRAVATWGAAIEMREVAIKDEAGLAEAMALSGAARRACGAPMLRREVAMSEVAGRAAAMALSGAANPARAVRGAARRLGAAMLARNGAARRAAGAPMLRREVAMREVAGRAAAMALRGADRPALALRGAARRLGAVSVARALRGAARRVNCRAGPMERPACEVAIRVEAGRPSAARPATTEVAMRLGAAKRNLSMPKSTPPYTLWTFASLDFSVLTISPFSMEIFEKQRSFHS
mmetsp:Transcript_141761/g.453256  ORF Transcript_141761/g.453256 Transcript_141761/m.453256 type:complete len:275 (+) Transcript_141761:908-1732(+)